MAQLDDPFADRNAVLHAAGLSADSCEGLITQWRNALLARPDGPEKLAARFGDAYQRALAVIAAARRGEVAPADPRFLNADAQAFRAEAAAVPLHAGEEAAPPVLPSPPAPALPTRVAPPPPEPPPVVPPPSRGWVPEGMRGFTVHGGTQLASDAPHGPALPFDPRAQPALPKADASMVPAGMKGFSVSGGTQLATHVPRGPALPFEGEPERTAVPPASLRAPPIAEPPLLSLEQYASLFVELGTTPSKARELLERYRVSEEQRRAIESYWREQMAADPAVRAAWDRACAAYQAWLLSTASGRRI
jgi:hypothetical protein